MKNNQLSNFYGYLKIDHGELFFLSSTSNTYKVDLRESNLFIIKDYLGSYIMIFGQAKRGNISIKKIDKVPFSTGGDDDNPDHGYLRALI